MIVVLSDLHITDETTDLNFSPEAFKILKTEVLGNITKKPPEVKPTEVRIVLLGDILDLVRTDYWLSNGIKRDQRPWGGTLDPKTGMNTFSGLDSQFNAILDNILKTKTAIGLQKVIQDLSDSAKTNGIYFKVSYVIGNHDRVIWNYPSLQNKISKFLLSKKEKDKIVFEFVQHVKATDYGLLARHGHEWSEECYSMDLYNEVLNKNGTNVGRFHPDLDQIMAIGEVITAEMMSGFIWRLKGHIDETARKKLMEVHTVRPISKVFEWINWFMESNNVNDGFRSRIITALRESIEDVLASSVAKKWDDIKSYIPFVSADITDKLEIIHSILSSNLNWYKILEKIAQYFDSLFNALEGSDDYIKGAESDFLTHGHDGIQYVVYGHTHEALSVYFEGNVNGRHKTYINTGTYLPLSQKARSSGFVSNYQMTLLTFYNKNEDTDGKVPNTTSMDMWNGVKHKIYV